MTTTAIAHLSRESIGRPAAPVRIVHLGLGAFHRAHQAWYTEHASDASEWGIASFTGRAGEPGDAIVGSLRDQDHLYTLAVRGPEHDEVEVIGSIVRAHSADDIDAFMTYLADPRTAIVTATVTEAGYRLDTNHRPDASDPVVASDLAALRTGSLDLESPLARIARGLDERRRDDAGPITVMPCDNMPDNGELVRDGLLAFASAISADLVAWIIENVSFVSTSVDRITPRFSDSDLESAREAGFADAVPVVTEPFINWILCGDFPAGRPAWETAGAQFVDDLVPFENRKLWLLNGSHTGMANLGRSRGLTTVADAAADPVCRDLVEAFWSEAVRHLPAEVGAEQYCRDLWTRFENPRIAHLLDQIAEDSLTKLRVRVAPVAIAERAAGRSAAGCARVVAAWATNVMARDGRRDSMQEAIDTALVAGDPVGALVTLVSPELGADSAFVTEVRASAAA